MYLTSKARAFARARLTAVPSGALAGAALGLALSGVYLAGGMAQDAADHARVSRLADAAAQGFSDEALQSVAAGADAGALALAQRHDSDLVGLAATPFGATISVKSAMSALRGGDAAQPFRANVLSQSRELDCLAQAVYYEARGETPAGQAAVAQVVLNRVRHPAFPKSICAVVFQGAQRGRGCQFSFACDGSTRGPRETGAWERAKRVASRAFDGQVMAGVGNATHFHVTSVQPGWTNLMRVAQVGAHVFYRFGGRSGSAKSFTDKHEPQLADIAPVAVDDAAAQVILASAPATLSDAPLAVDAAETPAVKTEAPVKLAEPTPAS